MSPKTHLITRRCLAVAASVGVLSLSLLIVLRSGYWNRLAYDSGSNWNPLFLVGAWILAVIQFLIPPGEPGTNMNPTFQLPSYWLFGFLGTALAFALSLPLLAWNRRPTSRARTISFVVWFSLVLALSVVNYANHDHLMRKEAQLLLDLVLVVLGSAAFVHLLRLSPTSVVGRSIHLLALFLLGARSNRVPRPLRCDFPPLSPRSVGRRSRGRVGQCSHRRLLGRVRLAELQAGFDRS